MKNIHPDLVEVQICHPIQQAEDSSLNNPNSENSFATLIDFNDFDLVQDIRPSDLSLEQDNVNISPQSIYFEQLNISQTISEKEIELIDKVSNTKVKKALKKSRNKLVNSGIYNIKPTKSVVSRFGRCINVKVPEF